MKNNVNFEKRYSYSKTSLWDTDLTFSISPLFLSRGAKLLPYLNMKSSPQEQSRIEQTLKLHNIKNMELYSNQDENMEKKVPEDMYLYSTKYSLFESILNLIKVKQTGYKHCKLSTKSKHCWHSTSLNYCFFKCWLILAPLVKRNGILGFYFPGQSGMMLLQE